MSQPSFTYDAKARAVVDCHGGALDAETISRFAEWIIRRKLQCKARGDERGFAEFRQMLRDLNDALVQQAQTLQARVTPNVFCRGGSLHLGSLPISREDAAWLHNTHGIDGTPEGVIQRARLLKAMEAQDQWLRASGGSAS